MNLRKQIMFWIFPKRCPLCHKIISAAELCCDKCHKIVDSSFGLYQTNIIIKKPLFHIPCISCFIYDGLIRSGILDFKFNFKKDNCAIFAKYISKAISNEYIGINFDEIVVVPSSPSKEQYNHLNALGKAISYNLGIPFKKNAFYKAKKIKKQHELNFHQRKSNVVGAFKLKKKYSVRDKRILIIDDIVTTGSTLKECGTQLLKNGAKQIHCATIAKTHI